jgi:hypothetical protein
VKHGAYLTAAKHDARDARDRHRRRGQREAAAILKAAGRESDPMSRLVARQIGRLEALAHRLECYHEARGYFTRAGEVKASVGREVEVVGRLLDEARRLFEQLSVAPAAAPPGNVIYRCVIPRAARRTPTNVGTPAPLAE